VTLGVYVHIPFCAHRCDYCDFATWTDRAHLVDAYVDACVTDLTRRVAGGQEPATSVFFGGGTPSLLGGDVLARILDAIPRAAGAEVTVECNPDSVDAAKFALYRRAGVNRLSFGVQSMRPHVLASLNRTHDPANVYRAIALARDAGIERLSVDLIYGTPGERLDDWQYTLDAALALDTEHVSAYALTVEAATPLGRSVAQGTATAPDDDDQADKYALTDDVMQRAGLEWYEVSNWAKPGGECAHNRCYWDGTDYVAIGCAAHGYTGGERWWNVRTPERYIARIEAGGDARAGSERLEPDARAEEAFALALRTRDGATAHSSASATVDGLVDGGMLQRRDDVVMLTRAGRLLASDVTARLLLAGAAKPADNALRRTTAAVSTRYD
jgi:putative oxygen-independent coproporphyrinogen III oxidase